LGSNIVARRRQWYSLSLISRRNIVKLSAVILIVLIGVVYWYYAEKRTSPIEEVEKTVSASQ
jgi:uncharacterized membrane protein YvbJ